MLQGWSVKKPATTLTLLSHLHVEPTYRFLETAPQADVEALLPVLFSTLERQHLCTVLSKLINSTHCHESLVALMREIQPQSIAEVLMQVPIENLIAVLHAPAKPLSDLVKAISPGGVLAPIVLQFLQRPLYVIEDTIVPMVANTKHTERIAKLFANVNPEVLMWLLGDIPGEQVAKFIDAGFCEDYEPQGHAMLMMEQIVGKEELVLSKLVPVLVRGDVVKLAGLLHEIKPHHLVNVLTVIEVDAFLCMVDNTHPEMSIRMFRVPLDSTMDQVAIRMATTMHQHPKLAEAVAVTSGGSAKVLDTTKRAKRRMSLRTRSLITLCSGGRS